MATKNVKDDVDPTPAGSAGGSPVGGARDGAGDGPAAANADVSDLPYEVARDELTSIVGRLESGQVGLEESMTLWERGEALAAHCATWLDAVEAKLNEAPSAQD